MAAIRPALRRFAWPVVIAALATALWFGRAERDLVDFTVYRTAAGRAIDAQPLYRPADGHWQFKYLPASALLLAPFAILPAPVARAAWYGLSVLALVLFVRLSVSTLPDRQLGTRALAWLVVLILGRFYIHELVLGQSNILLGALLITAVVAGGRGHAGAAGALVGLAVFVKPYALILLPWLPIAFGWPALAAAAGVLAAGLLVPAAAYGWSGNLALHAAWLRTVTDTTASNLGFPENISLAAMWTRRLGAGDAARGLTAASSLAFGAAVALVLWWRARTRQPAYLEFGLLMLGVALLSPQGWDYVLLVATAAVLTIVNAYGRMGRVWRALIAPALVVVGFTIFDLLGRTLYARVMSWSVVTVATLVLVAALVEVRRTRLA
ncbi:MAG: glycosyltransferase family 87 protein [Vicinamibacterales bacterium]